MVLGSDMCWNWERSNVRKLQSWISLNYACKTKRQMRENEWPGTLNEETAS